MNFKIIPKGFGLNNYAAMESRYTYLLPTFGNAYYTGTTHPATLSNTDVYEIPVDDNNAYIEYILASPSYGYEVQSGDKFAIIYNQTTNESFFKIKLYANGVETNATYQDRLPSTQNGFNVVVYEGPETIYNAGKAAPSDPVTPIRITSGKFTVYTYSGFDGQDWVSINHRRKTTTIPIDPSQGSSFINDENFETLSYKASDDFIFKNDSEADTGIIVSIGNEYESGTIDREHPLTTTKKYVVIYNDVEIGDDGNSRDLSNLYNNKTSVMFNNPDGDNVRYYMSDLYDNSVISYLNLTDDTKAIKVAGSCYKYEDEVLWFVSNYYTTETVSFPFFKKEPFEDYDVDLKNTVRYTFSKVLNPIFGPENLINGANYSKNVNSSTDLAIGDVSIASLTWTSITDANDLYKLNRWEFDPVTTIDEDTIWEFYVQDTPEDSYIKMGEFKIVNEDYSSTNYMYTAYDGLNITNKSADRFLSLSISDDDKFHWTQYQIGASNTEVQFTFNSTDTLTVPSGKGSDAITCVQGQLRFKGTKQINFHPYKIRAVRAKFMGNVDTGLISSSDVPSGYTWINGQNVSINDNNRFLVGYRAKINPTKLKNKILELGLDISDFNIRNYNDFTNTIYSCMDVVEGQQDYPLWVLKNTTMSGYAWNTGGNFILPAYRRKNDDGSFTWVTISTLLNQYAHVPVLTSDTVPSSSSWVDWNGDYHYIAPENRYPSEYSNYSSSQSVTEVNVTKTWALWGVSVDEFWCTDLSVLNRDISILSWELIEDMYDYTTAVGPIGDFSFFGYNSRIYQITNFEWLNTGNSYYSDDYRITAKEISILNTSDVSNATNLYGEEYFEYSNNYWYYYVLISRPNCDTIEDFYELVLGMLQLSFTNLTQSIGAYAFSNMLPASGLTYRNLLEFIAEACGGFMHCNDSGEVCVDNYIKRDVYINDTEYAKKDSAYYSVPVIDNLRVFVDEYNSNYIEFGLGSNDYFITGNPLLYVLNVTIALEPYAKDIFTQINLVDYIPMTLKLYDNPNNVKVGDIIWVDGKQTIVMSVEINTNGYIFTSTGSKERQKLTIRDTNQYTSVDGNYSNIDRSYENINLVVGDDTNNYKLIVTKTGAYTQKDGGAIVPIGSGGGTSVTFSYDSTTNTLTITQ